MIKLIPELLCSLTESDLKFLETKSQLKAPQNWETPTPSPDLAVWINSYIHSFK